MNAYIFHLEVCVYVYVCVILILKAWNENLWNVNLIAIHYSAHTKPALTTHVTFWTHVQGWVAHSSLSFKESCRNKHEDKKSLKDK